MSDPVVICESLGRKYGDFSALSDIHLEISRGEIFGLIGPDGAGKTTFFRILSTLILPDRGSAKVLGFDVVREYKRIRAEVGYMPGRFSLYQDLTVEENLRFYASIFAVKIQENYHLIKNIYQPLEPFRKRRAGKLSGGMKQKLALACALIHKPRLLILDEPTTGVDAVSRKEFWEHLRELKQEGITILVSTPYMDEAQRCDRLALLQSGRILDLGNPEQIRSGFEGKLFSLESGNRYQTLKLMRTFREVNSVQAFGQILHFNLVPGVSTEVIYNRLIEAGTESVKILEIDPGIEDCFMQKMS
jgi:ABC-2 type transport system ATP-binding protein